MAVDVLLFPARLIVELMLETAGSPPEDVKVFCFAGERWFLQVDWQRYQGHRRDLYVLETAILVGELTFYPTNCSQLFRPVEADLEIARPFEAPSAPVVLPGVALQTWFGFLVVHIILTRVPVLPAKDLLFLGAGIGLASAVGLPEAAVAGMLLATSALTHLGNLILFVLTSFVTHD